MNGRSLGISAGLLLATAITTAPPAAAGVDLIGEMKLQIHCSNAEGSAHPRRLEVVQPILGTAAAGFDLWPVFAGYVGIPDLEESAAYDPAAGVKRMTIEVRQVKADGSRQTLARFRPRVRPDGTASAGKRVETRLEAGDLLHWQLTFKPKRGGLLESECFFLVLGFGQVEDQLPALASLALGRKAG